jgi:hypothetical protein
MTQRRKALSLFCCLCVPNPSPGCLAVDRTAFQKYCEEYQREVAIGVLVHGTLISNRPPQHCHRNSTRALNVGIHQVPPILFLSVG